MTEFKRVTAGPKAASLISSLRSIGYSFNDAIADIIDNSISAGANNVDIFCGWKDEISTVEIADNGHGMTKDELIEAMTIGAKSPLDTREESDLGRFGLGLKTASFSQSQILEVESWTSNSSNCIAKWDLEKVIAENEWLLDFAENVSQSTEWITGTVVRWKILDKSGIKDKDEASDTLAQYVSALEDDLSLIYHRFLEQGLKITINGIAIKPKNPFFPEKAQSGPLEKIYEGSLECRVQAFTLPHKSKCKGDEYERNKGKGSYIESQGFYVYRNNRLILGGSWFGIAPKLNSTKLCRISIDIDSRFDRLWDIDIKKSRAYPPPKTRKRLRDLTHKWVTGSRDRQLNRRRSLPQNSKLPLWSRQIKSGSIQYQINRENPLYLETVKGLDKNQRSKIDEYFNAIQSAIPINSIYDDIKEDSSSIEQESIDENILIKHAQTYLDYLTEKGKGRDESLRILSKVELYRLRWEVIRENLK